MQSVLMHRHLFYVYHNSPEDIIYWKYGYFRGTQQLHSHFTRRLNKKKKSSEALVLY